MSAAGMMSPLRPFTLRTVSAEEKSSPPEAMPCDWSPVQVAVPADSVQSAGSAAAGLMPPKLNVAATATVASNNPGPHTRRRSAMDRSLTHAEEFQFARIHSSASAERGKPRHHCVKATPRRERTLKPGLGDLGLVKSPPHAEPSQNRPPAHFA